MNLVLFDFDDTVTKLDTTLPFGAGLVGQPKRRGRLLLLIAALGLVKFRLLTNTGLKKLFARLFFRGRTLGDVRELTDKFYQTQISTLVDAELLGRLRLHVEQGDSVYLVSANFECLLEPLIARWSLAGVIGTRAELSGEVYTGNLTGVSCHGDEKARRVIARFGREAVTQAIAYGNRDDAPLLRQVKIGYLIHRPKPRGLVGRWRRLARKISGKISQEDISPAPIIEIFPASD